ncbi:ScbR family autoregulator-binding transcription factor [Streptomyces sp. NPDC048718]|uniref:ScbR family autoregulator-binding transcription factor n=1 Tax=Streptomyces sp. NPDC048718 TaxID=3365587 RepID=UPI00371DD28D
MAKQDRAIRTRRAILEAAATVFDERGYEAATLSEILALAQVTKGALYFHFDSKEDLAHAVLDAQTVTVPPAPQQASKVQEFVDSGMVFAHRLTRDRVLSGSVRLTLEQSGPELDRSGPYREWTDINRSLLRAAKESGELLPHADPEELAGLVVGAFAGLNLMTRALGGGQSAMERWASVLYQHVLPSVVVPAVLAVLDMDPTRGARVLGVSGEPECTVPEGVVPESAAPGGAVRDKGASESWASPGVPGSGAGFR